MLKYLPICAALAVLGTASVSAQQREAIFQKVEVPNAGFNLVLAMPASGAPRPSDQSDPNVVYLMSEELVYSLTGNQQEPLDVGTLMTPACSFHVDRREGGPPTPMVISVAPKIEIPLSPATR